MKDKPEWVKVMQEKLQAYVQEHNEKMQNDPEYRKQHEEMMRSRQEALEELTREAEELGLYGWRKDNEQ